MLLEVPESRRASDPERWRCCPRAIAIGRANGKHRAAGLVEFLAHPLRERGRAVEHRHARLPRVLT